MKDSKDTIARMKPWYAKVEGMSNDERRAWNSAILAAAELIRRLDDYDETRALAVHSLLADKLPCRAPAPLGEAEQGATEDAKGNTP